MERLALAGAHWFGGARRQRASDRGATQGRLPHGGRNIIRCIGRREDQGALREGGF